MQDSSDLQEDDAVLQEAVTDFDGVCRDMQVGAQSGGVHACLGETQWQVNAPLFTPPLPPTHPPAVPYE